MPYVLIRYRHHPEQVHTLQSTREAAEAVAFVQSRTHIPAEEGLLVLLDNQELVHCPPRRSETHASR